METMFKRQTVVAFLVALGIGAACGLGLNSSEEESKRPEEKTILTEHRPLTASKASKQRGEDCTVYGRTECLSGVCLHVGADRNTGYFCSSACTRREDCPAEWNCNQLYPGPGGSACVPPSGWTGKVASARSLSHR